MTTSPQHPWQNGPTELIRHGIQHMHRNSDSDLRISFLLLDVGVETLLKTFLELPDTVTGTTMSFSDRKKAVESNFHEVVLGVGKAAGSKLKGVNLQHVDFFHNNIRNKLYHEGNGITVSAKDTSDYAVLAVTLLHRLLDIDLTDALTEPEREAQAIRDQQQQLKALTAFVDELAVKVKGERAVLEQDIEAATEYLAPRLLLPSFVRKLHDLKASHSEPDFVSTPEGDAFEYASVPVYRKPQAVREITNLVGSMIDKPDVKDAWLAAKMTYTQVSSHGLITEEKDGHPLELGDLSFIEAEDIYAVLIDVIITDESLRPLLGFASGFPDFLLGSQRITLELNKEDFAYQADILVKRLKTAQQLISKWLVEQDASL